MLDGIPRELHELIDAVGAYSAKLADTISKSENCVQEWLLANECMVQLFPLSQEAVTVGSDRWYTTNGVWGSRDEAGRYYQHGVNKDGEVILVRHDTQVRKVFVRGEGFIDELILAGESLRGTVRYFFSVGKLSNSSYISWPVGSQIQRDYTYDGDYLLEERVRYSVIDLAEVTLTTNDIEPIHRLGWDNSRPKRNLIDVKSDRGELLYVGYHHLRLLNRPRKPIVAFTLNVDEMDDEAEADRLAGQCYSLEMTADFDWEFDRVLFCLPESVSKITQESDVCSTGLCAGGINVQSVEEMRAVAEQGGKWVWIDAIHEELDTMLNEASQNEMKVLLNVNAKAVRSWNNIAEATHFHAIAAIFCNLEEPDDANSRSAVCTIRDAMQSSAEKIRILIPFDPNCGTDLIDSIEAADADGVYIDRVDIWHMITLLNQVGLHSYTSVPLSVDSRHLLSGL